MEMDINFETEKRKSSLGERYRDQVDDKDDDKKVESDMEMDNFQRENMDFSIGKPYLDEYFPWRLAVPEKQRSRYGTITTEVFRVTINIPEGRHGYLSGKIYCGFWSEFIYFYKREGEHGQHIQEGCDLLTTASGVTLNSYGDLYLFVDLLFSTSEYQTLTNCEIPQLAKRIPNTVHIDSEGNLKGNLIDFFAVQDYDMENDDTDNEVEDIEGNFIRISNCKGCFGKNGRFKAIKFYGLSGLTFCPSVDEEYYDKASSYTVRSKDDTCSVTIFYAVFRNAVQATVEVVWLKDEEPEFGVYGLVAARNDMIKEDDYEIILFLKEDLSQSVPVLSGQPIQLSRSVLAVPINSNLLVRAHLRTKYKHFPSAKLLFPAQQSGISELSINGTMQVKVTWQRIP